MTKSVTPFTWRRSAQSTRAQSRSRGSALASLRSSPIIEAKYRAVYTVRCADRVYVLHVFQKKSKKGIATPQSEIDLVRQRLRRAAELDQKREH